MQKPRIDILLPYWGEFALLKKTVESILTQTSTAWRLQVFDDCYPSKEAFHYFKQLKDPRITYFRHERNIGITKNFNYALQHATAEYCVMIGCDDMMLPNYVETALAHIGNADFYQPGVEVIDENDRVYLPLTDRVKDFIKPRESVVLAGEKLASSLCIGDWLYFPSITWKTAIIKKYGFDAKYKIVEDLALELNIIKDGGVLSYDTTITFQYRRSAQSLSSKEKSKDGVRFSEENDMYRDFAKRFRSMGWRKAEHRASIHITSRINQLLSRLM